MGKYLTLAKSPISNETFDENKVKEQIADFIQANADLINSQDYTWLINKINNEVGNTLWPISAQYLIALLASETNLLEKITSISRNLFAGNPYIESIRFPDNIKELLPAAFSGCRNLKDVEFNNTITEIPSYCFEDTDIKTFILPSTIKKIDKWALGYSDDSNIIIKHDHLISVHRDYIQYYKNHFKK